MPAEPGPQDHPKLNADRAWGELMHTVSKRIPHHLRQTADARRALSHLRRGVRR